MNERARIFISCGQRSSDEIGIAENIQERLNHEGYDPRLAITHQSLRALKENLFPLLTDIEYFLFIDFRREPIEENDYRGSLFSHQELAIASYLDKDFLGFQEEGVVREGLLGFLQGNCIGFSDRTALPELVVRHVKSRWNPRWQNRLDVQLSEKLYVEELLEKGNSGRFFHLRVTNMHHRRVARNCVAYIRSIVDSITKEPVEFESVELKWAGYLFPTVSIQPRSSRRLDAFWIPHMNPPHLRFRCFADWSGAVPDVRSTDMIITYEVLSDSVPGHTAAIRVRLGDTFGDTAVTDYVEA